MSINTTNNYTQANLASDITTLQNYASNGVDVQAQDLCMMIYSIADLALQGKDLSVTLTTLQDLDKQIAQIFIPSRIGPLKAIVRYLLTKAQPAQIGQPPILNLPTELFSLIFSDLSIRDLGRLSRVCKAEAIQAATESGWEKICQQEIPPERISKKRPQKLWKIFYRDTVKKHRDRHSLWVMREDARRARTGEPRFRINNM